MLTGLILLLPAFILLSNPALASVHMTQSCKLQSVAVLQTTLTSKLTIAPAP